jgi:hypothetical protein
MPPVIGRHVEAALGPAARTGQQIRSAGKAHVIAALGVERNAIAALPGKASGQCAGADDHVFGAMRAAAFIDETHAVALRLDGADRSPVVHQTLRHQRRMQRL